MRWLADTNVLSELARLRPHPGVLEWAANVPRVAISVVTVEEVHFGLSWKPNERLRGWFDRFFADSCDIVDVTDAIAAEAGTIRGTLQARGLPRSPSDMLIAATARVHGLTLVTRNVRDFAACGIDVFNPFT